MTADVTSLYTNITTESGAKAIEHYIDMYPECLPRRFSKQFVIEIFCFLQNNLYFSFDGIVYRQKGGTGMGKIYAPALALADIKIGFLEIQLETKLGVILNEEMLKYFVEQYLRYLDDVWLIWRKSWVYLLPSIFQVMNSIDPRIKFTFETSCENTDNSIAYLDTRISILDGDIDVDIFAKETDTFNYLPFHSAHPRHVVRNIPYCLARRIRGIVSNPAKVPIRMQQMKCRLKHKKYPNKLINDAIDRAMALPRRDIIDPLPKVQTTQVEDDRTKVYCVTTFDPKVSHPGNQLDSLLERFNEGRTTEKEKFTVQCSFRKNPSLQQLITFKKPANSKGVFKCLSGCTLCKPFKKDQI